MKLYRVCAYKSGKEILIGTAEECAKLIGFKDKVSFQRFVKKIETGSFTGKKHGYKAYYYNTDEAIHQKNLKVLDAFYNKYLRSPTSREFIKCGGDYLMAMRRCENWCDYLELCGYDRAMRYKTVEVYDPNGKVCYTGTIPDVSEEFCIAKSYLRTLVCKEKCNGEGYLFKYKPFTGIEVEQ